MHASFREDTSSELSFTDDVFFHLENLGKNKLISSTKGGQESEQPYSLISKAAQLTAKLLIHSTSKLKGKVVSSFWKKKSDRIWARYQCWWTNYKAKNGTLKNVALKSHLTLIQHHEGDILWAENQCQVTFLSNALKRPMPGLLISASALISCSNTVVFFIFFIFL